MINWFELIVGIIELGVAIYLTKIQHEARYSFFLLASVHLGNAFHDRKEK